MKKIFFFTCNLQAQSVGIDTTMPNASAMLDISAGNKGLLIPQISLTDITNITTIPSAANSLLIYNRATAGIGPLSVTPGYYYWEGLTSTWIRHASSSSNQAAWLFTGNVNATLPTNFIGNNDNQSLLFKINNTNAGYPGTTGNTYWGLKSGNIGSNGASNVAIGNAALSQTTNHSNLVASGDSALLNNGISAKL